MVYASQSTGYAGGPVAVSSYGGAAPQGHSSGPSYGAQSTSNTGGACQSRIPDLKCNGGCQGYCRR